LTNVRVILKTPIETLALIIETAYDEFEDGGEFDETDDDALASDDDDEDPDVDEPADDDDEEDWEEAEAGDVEFIEVLSELSEEERAELLALAAVGNGEFDAESWDEALAAARAAGEAGLLTRLLAIPDLGDALESGLEILGYTVTANGDDEPPG
jgi:hypothetical protein